MVDLESWQRLRKHFRFPPKYNLILSFALAGIQSLKLAKLLRLKDRACHGWWCWPLWQFHGTAPVVCMAGTNLVSGVLRIALPVWVAVKSNEIKYR